MRIFNIIAIFIYTLIFSIIGAVLIALSLRAASFDSTLQMINYAAHTSNIKMWLALTGFLLIFINISIAQLSIGKLRKQRTIAFENPQGEVTLALSAIEDYIIKLASKMPEIRDIKSKIQVTKAGIEIIAKVALYSEVNIPEVTEKIQSAIHIRLQEMLGIEEKVTIKINVTKIVQKDKRAEKKRLKEAPSEVEGQAKQGGFKGEIEYGR
ncbi:MAG: alkaline shock response membrane anchor protein AmaP [Candidatus Omnitrophica bacterium]|nr:alkaline shock response membrane anchor protein AmaP [Candidatus Omnitrophota bacterium]MBU4590458.1 alkaline shock response membrane anchor protein AmaP [Candidatus Omnitrophota bacterium]